MIADDIDSFLKFLDDVSLQLACLLDVDGQRTARKSNARQRIILTPRSRGLTKSRATKGLPANIKRDRSKLRQPTRARGRRKLIADLIGVDIQASNREPPNQSNLQPELDRRTHPNSTHIQEISNGQHQEKLQHPNISPETHTLDGRLTLSIADELPLDHGASISPTTHLSPMDPTIGHSFNTMHQQHYYPIQRSQTIDSYQLHDEFTNHEQIPISSQASHVGAQEHRMISHHMMSVQQAPVGTNSLDQTDCYAHHHHNIQHQHQTHQVQYNQMDGQPWLGGGTHPSDSILQLTTPDSSPLEQVVTLSSAAAHHQALDQVQFSNPLYHHGYYASHQSEHMETFQHLSDDYVTSPHLANASSSTVDHLHRQVQQQNQQQAQQQQQSHHNSHHHQPQAQIHPNQQQQQQIRMNPSDNTQNENNSNNNYETHHLQHQISGQIHGSQAAQQTMLSVAPYSHQSLGQHHHHQHHMLPLMSLEPNGVIIQDINLASASWSSPEDLYSI